MSQQNHDQTVDRNNGLIPSAEAEPCENSPKPQKAMRVSSLNPESQVALAEFTNSSGGGNPKSCEQHEDPNARKIGIMVPESDGPQQIEYNSMPDLYTEVIQNTPQLGKRSPDNEVDLSSSKKQQKTEGSVQVAITQELEISDSVPLDCEETLNLKKLKPIVGISQQRPKREVKKNVPYDNSVYITGDDDALEEKTRRESTTRHHKSRSHQAHEPSTGQKQGVQALRLQKVSESQDPFNSMYRFIMEPIIALDKLQVLFADKEEYEVLIKAKDLKACHIKQERKEEYLTQRVHIEQNEQHELLIICDLDSKFQRHSEMSSKQEDAEMEDDSVPRCLTLEPSSTDNLISCDDLHENSAQDNEEFKRPVSKKGNKKSKRGSQSSKRSQSCLPYSIRECTWLQNTENNVKLLNEKNLRIKEEREKRKSEEKATIEKLLQENKAQVHFVKIQEQGKEELESGEIPFTQEANAEMVPEEVEPEKPSELEVEKQPVAPAVEQPFKYVHQHEITSIDQISDKFKSGYYHRLDRLLEDLQYLVANTIQNRCKNALAKIYLTNFLLGAQKLIKEKRKEFHQKWVFYFDIRLGNNQNNNCMVGHGDPNVWYKKFDQSTKREYFEIQDYKIKIPGEAEPTKEQHESEQKVELTPKQLKEKERVYQIMKTQKSSKCSGECCTDQDSADIVKPKTSMHMSDLFLQSKCECIKRKTECGPECGCDPQVCRNRQMSLNQSLKFGVDVEERVTWGIDICTAVNFLTVCPRDVPRVEQSHFIEKKLIYAIQQQNEQGYDVLRALKFIMEADLNDEIHSKKFTKQDQEMASIVYDAIINLPTKNEYHFRVHTKGVGIFCKMKDGIKKDSLVVEYFGEIYRPWHWYEKQDIIKQGQNFKQLPKELPEFYNILFERHLDDPQGYNILTVDPILHGNYSSRLSHSCIANCHTINKVRNGLYSIGMFTKQDISYGEELCFDYCSFTESEKEYEEAICLCGTEYCKGRFLNLANDKKNLSIMKNNHTFIDRNYLLFKAITEHNLTQEDKERLHQNGIRESTLQGAPDWLQKWASLICEYLEYEEILYPDFFKNEFPENYKLEDIKVEARMQKETQIQNIAITIDKIMHVLESMGTDLPPIRALNYQEMFTRIWVEQGCLKENVMDVLHKIESCPQVEQAKVIMQQQSVDTTIVLPSDQPEDDEMFYKSKYEKARKSLADISAILRSVNSTKVAVPAFCDILMLYANTETYFTPTEVYKKSKSDNVIIRRCDVRHGEGASMDKFSQGRQAYKNCKEYDSQYIWGQLVVWFKQTVDKPNASLSADRRGTLSIPDVHSFIITKAQYVDASEPVKKKKQVGRKKQRESAEEVLPTQGSRSRPRATETSSFVACDTGGDCDDLNSPQPDGDDQTIQIAMNSNGQKEPLIIYPSKRLQKREEFLAHWRETFSKQWDVCCKWKFQNKKKMYGSIQFESVLQADRQIREQFKVTEGMSDQEKKEMYHKRYQAFLDHRLDYFDEVVKRISKY